MSLLHRPHFTRHRPRGYTPARRKPSAHTESSNRLLGARVDPLTMDETVETIEDLIEDQSGHYNHLAMNAAKLVSASHDQELVDKFATATLVTADGQSLVWASKLLGAPLPERVAGIDLMDRLVDASVEKGYRIYLLGATDSVVRQVRWRFLARGANVVGFHNGFWRREELTDQQMADRIALTNPDIVFVGVPSPLKEDFVFAHKDRTGAGICVGVGGSFDVVAGITSRAPKVIQKIGMEWFWRLAQEPRRMFKRYLVGNSKFVWLVVRARLNRD